MAKSDAFSPEGGGAGGCATHHHGTVVFLCEQAAVYAAAIDRGGTLNLQMTQGIHRSTKSNGTCSHVGVTTENDGPHQAESAGACQIAIHGSGARAGDAPLVGLCTRGDRACQIQTTCATVDCGVSQQADRATNTTQDHGLICRAQGAC